MSGIKINTTQKKSSKKGTANSIQALLNKDISFSSGAWSDSKKEQLYAELSTLLNSGLDVRLSLEMLADGQTNQKGKDVLSAILNHVVSGDSLSDAIEKSNKFSSYEYFSIRIGEETGKLAHVLNDLALYYKKRIKQKRQVVNALAYPVIVLCTAFGAILFMMYFIVPMFADVFKRFGGDLPEITKLIIAISEGLMIYFPWFALLLTTLIIFVVSQKNQLWFRKGKDIVISNIPFFGELYRKSNLAQFCSIMSLLVGAKIHLLQAIELTEKIVSFYPIQSALETVKKEVLQGKPFHKSIASFKVFDRKMVSLIKVGEEVNQLEKFFEKIAEQYSDEVDHKTSVMGNFIEPLLLIFLGFVVGTVLIAMYLPMFKLSSNFG